MAESGLMRLPAKKLTGVTRSEGSNPSRTAMSWGTRLLPRCKGKILLTEKQILNTVNILLTVFFCYLGLLGTRMVASRKPMVVWNFLD